MIKKLSSFFKKNDKESKKIDLRLALYQLLKFRLPKSRIDRLTKKSGKHSDYSDFLEGFKSLKNLHKIKTKQQKEIELRKISRAIYIALKYASYDKK